MPADGGRPADHHRSTPATAALRVDRRVSSRGSIMIARQKIQVGIGHAGRTVTVEADTTFRVYDGEQSLIDEQREPS